MERSLAFAFSALRREELSSGTLKEVAFLGTTYGREPAETTTAHIQLTMSSARNHHSAC